MMKRSVISSPHNSVAVNLYPTVLDLSHLDGTTTITTTSMQCVQTSSCDYSTVTTEFTQNAKARNNQKSPSSKDTSNFHRAIPDQSGRQKTIPTENVRSNASKRLMEHQKELSNLQELPRFTYHRRFVSANATMNSSSNRYHQNHKNNMIPKKLHHPKDGITFLKAHRRAHSEGAPQSYLAHDASSASLFWEQPLSNKKLSRFQDNYVLTKQIFHNKNSDIYECIHQKTGLQRCVKILNQKSREAEMLKVVQGSTHIVNLVEIIEETDTEKTFIVMELLEDENLLSRVVQSDGLDEATVKTIVRDLLHGIQHLHGLGITHNNLHPSNVLTVNHDENGDDEGFHVKIADFGHASGDESVNNSTVSNSNTERSTKTSRTIFQAPENTTSQASDMWSVGAILCFCITGGQILQEKSHEALVRKLQGDLGKTSSKYAALSRCGKQLLCGLLHTDPTVRLTVSEALEHTWFTDAENQSGISTSEGVQWNRGRGRKPSSRKVREHVSSEPLLRSSTTFTRSVTKMVQHFSYRKL